MTQKKDEALKLARVLLNQRNGVFNIPKWQQQKAIDAIDEALTEQPAPAQEYVGGRLATPFGYVQPALPQEQPPVAWRTKNATPPGGYVVFQQYPQAVADLGVEIEPLYTSPPASKPLTDEQVTAAARVLNDRQAQACGVDKDDQWKFYSDDFKADARAMLEAAHAKGGA